LERQGKKAEKKENLFGEREREGKMAEFNRAAHARRNAIRARSKRIHELANPEKLLSHFDETATRMIAVTTALAKQQMKERNPSEEWSKVRPAIRATIAEALLVRLGDLFPELCLKEGATTDRVSLGVSEEPKVAAKPWRGVLTAAHVKKYGERVCPECELRLAIGDKVTVQKGEVTAFHENCKPGTGGKAPGVVRIIEVTERHLAKGGKCHHCQELLELGGLMAWRFGWRGILHHICWAELGKPESLEKSTA
jgi:hypothetical protein